MRERVIRIGQSVPLVGIMSEPDQPAQGRTAMLLMNSGVMHRVGACRLSVLIARAVCEQLAIPAVRFDFSGVGDSEPRQQVDDFESAGEQEVREVMDYLSETRGINQFILYGLCSGAHVACRVGVVDPRVRYLIQIDGHCYATWKSNLRHYGKRLLSPSRWPRAVARLLRGDRRPRTGAEVAGVESRFFEVPNFGDRPRREDIAKRLQGVVSNGVTLYCIYTGNDPTYNYKTQFRDCYHEVDFGTRLTLSHLPDSSHIIPEPDCQVAVVSGIVDWLKSQDISDAADMR
jgi:pimeloyl-ACP methyl ester carboxylesterase